MYWVFSQQKSADYMIMYFAQSLIEDNTMHNAPQKTYHSAKKNYVVILHNIEYTCWKL